MLSMLNNNYNRMLQRLAATIILIAVTLVSIIFAVYLSGSEQSKDRIALINPTGTVQDHFPNLSITAIKKEPPYSALVRQQYDAFVFDHGNGDFEIKTLKNKEFKDRVMNILTHKETNTGAKEEKRGVGVNIIGFLMTFLLVGAFTNLFTFAQDKEQGLLNRISMSPVSFAGYLAANGIYCLSLFLPAYIMIAGMSVLGFDVGFSLLQYGLLFLVLGMLGISFALFLNTLVKKSDDASLLGNSILILSSVLAGTFFPFSKGNRVLDMMVSFLPQKQLIDFAQHIQSGNALANPLSLCYVAAFSLILFLMAYILLKGKYVKKI